MMRLAPKHLKLAKIDTPKSNNLLIMTFLFFFFCFFDPSRERHIPNKASFITRKKQKFWLAEIWEQEFSGEGVSTRFLFTVEHGVSL